MKCTVKEMIDYLSAFPPNVSFEVTGGYGLSGSVWIDGLWQIHSADDALPTAPIRNTSLEYTGDNYSD